MTQPQIIPVLYPEHNLYAYLLHAVFPTQDLKPDGTTQSPNMVSRNNAARASGSQRLSKSPAPAVVVEPSVPAPCVSLLSLRAGDRTSVPSHGTPSSASNGNLPMLTTALSLLEGAGRSAKLATTAGQHKASSPENLNYMSPLKRTAPRANAGTESAVKQVRQKKSSGSRFWDTVLPAGKDSHHSRPRSSRPPTSVRPVGGSAAAGAASLSDGRSASLGSTPVLPRPASGKAQAHGAGREGAGSSRMTEEDESNKMNIPCVKCGVRFRKPGHLSMHWRHVHAASADVTYPGPVRALSSASAPRTERSPDARISKAKGVRPYGCPQCLSRFRRGSDRNRHMRMVHAKIRPFECTQCGSHFGRKSFLEAHISTVHEKQRPLRCECGAAFRQRSRGTPKRSMGLLERGLPYGRALEFRSCLTHVYIFSQFLEPFKIEKQILNRPSRVGSRRALDCAYKQQRSQQRSHFLNTVSNSGKTIE